MRIIKTKLFNKWAIKNKVRDELLITAAEEISIEVYEANYGGGVIKKRIGNKGRGKSGSTRTIVAFKKGKNCFFVFGFEKNTKSNITINEEKAFKIVAQSLLTYSDLELNELIKDGSLVEIKNEKNY
ncbi:type II toxin-antitoxin system RelE/ParE family toxin [Legionella fairfieldensis]|uniref:type II toxin-antitoxin system RelE/ParE family toxin n=1 Tax=Legionella fairfieldensis TaxID=45064 RepID=UPI00048B6549|nr:type II toxin-antitoxin system RelE/ParE family toxin [Legionella fairfieldensis]